jgi:hypothetical protein
MTSVTLQLQETPASTLCSLCGQPASSSAGVRLALADGTDSVCAGCARRRAPALAALVELAHAAARVSRIGRHGVFPPLTALLDLARAAEDYTGKALPPCRQVG